MDCNSEHNLVEMNLTDSPFLLNHSTVRLPSPPLGTRPVWNNSKLRWDQLFLMYPLPNWCKDHDGNLIPQGYCRTIAEQLLGEAKNSEVFKTLSDPSKRVTSLLAEGMENRVIAEFCMNKARKMHLNFTIKSNLQLPWGETST